MSTSPEGGFQKQNEKEPSTAKHLEGLVLEVESGEAGKKIIDVAIQELYGYRNALGLGSEGDDISEPLKERSRKADEELVEIEKTFLELKRRLNIP